MFHDIELMTTSQMEQVSKQIIGAKLAGVGGAGSVHEKRQNDKQEQLRFKVAREYDSMYD